MGHKVENQKAGTAYGPDCPAPQPQQEEPCEGQVQLTGQLVMPCCCPRLYTRTMIIALGPQTEPQLQALLQTTVSNYEAGGYLIMAHHIADVGAGWQLGLTIGWYA